MVCVLLYVLSFFDAGPLVVCVLLALAAFTGVHACPTLNSVCSPYFPPRTLSPRLPAPDIGMRRITLLVSLPSQALKSRAASCESHTSAKQLQQCPEL